MNWLDLERRRNPTPTAVALPDRFEEARLKLLWDGSLKEMAVSYCEKAEELIDQGVAPFFVGRSGTGKTTAAAAIARVISIGYHIETTWASAPDVLTRLKYQRWKGEEELLALMRVPFLVLDDIAVFPPTSEEFGIWLRLMTQRFDDRRPTLYTANLALSSKPFEDLAQKYGPLVARRLQEGSGDYALSLL